MRRLPFACLILFSAFLLCGPGCPEVGPVDNGSGLRGFESEQELKDYFNKCTFPMRTLFRPASLAAWQHRSAIALEVIGRSDM